MKLSISVAVCLIGLTATTALAAGAKKAHLPLAIYNDAGMGSPSYVPSGYMGTTAAIQMDANCKVKPHSGKTCLKAAYTAPDKWAGVVWQDPANDWGTAPGGYNLSGAKKLTFWARGDKGGEVVTFKFGVIAATAKYHDTSTGQVDTHLTTGWKKYSINLAGKNLSDIKTGFCWVVAGTGKPTTFYIDDVQYQ